MPLDVPPPDTLMNGREVIAKYGDRVPENIRRYWERDRPIEMKPVFLQHYTSREKLPPVQQIWIRATGPVPDDRATQSVVLAYLSDMTLLDTSTFAHGRALFDPRHPGGQPRPRHVVPPAAPLDGWLLYAQDSPSASGARGFTRGLIYAEDGTLVASVAQEGLIRLQRVPPK